MTLEIYTVTLAVHGCMGACMDSFIFQNQINLNYFCMDSLLDTHSCSLITAAGCFPPGCYGSSWVVPDHNWIQY